MATQNTKEQDAAQQAIQKSMNTFMPIMLTAMFVFIPIPAGVLLYLISSNVMQVLQTVIVNKQLDAQEEAKKQKVDDVDLNRAKKIEPKK